MFVTSKHPGLTLESWLLPLPLTSYYRSLINIIDLVTLSVWTLQQRLLPGKAILALTLRMDLINKI